MTSRLVRLLLFSLIIPASLAAFAQKSILPTPSEFLGFQVGADRQLADYKQIVSYFRMLEKQSPKIVRASFRECVAYRDVELVR